MSDYTPTMHDLTIALGYWGRFSLSDADAAVNRFLATVRPDPADAAQVETVADVEINFKIRHPNGGGTIKTRIGPTNARAVLTALAEAVGKP